MIAREDAAPDCCRAGAGRGPLAAAAVTRWRSLQVAVFGRAPGGSALAWPPGPGTVAVAACELHQRLQAVTPEQAADVIAIEDASFDIDPRLSDAEREEHARAQVAVKALLDERGLGACTADAGAAGPDGQLPLAAGSTLLANGYGYAPGGDVLAACLARAGHQLIGDAHVTGLHAVDYPSGSVLMADRGGGNWKLARADRPVRLVRRPPGAAYPPGPPAFLFQHQPGPATLATLVALDGGGLRLVVAEGENLDAPPLPALALTCGPFRPAAGLRALLTAWRPVRGPHHEVMNLGHHAASWRAFCQLAGIEFAAA
jgi:L-arabinose isomerase